MSILRERRPEASGPSVRFRVATFNIHHGAKANGVLDLDGTARAIEALDCDIIGLQEVDRFFSKRSDFVDQGAWLADRLGMHAQYAPTIDLEPSARSAEAVGASTRRQYGIALLSRFPISNAWMARLPESRVVERRGVLLGDIDVHGHAVRVAVTHLATSPSKVRREQFKAVREMALIDTTPTVIVGDLNAAPYNMRDYHTFTKGLHDVWAVTHRFPLRSVVGGRTNPVTPLRVRRIDYILATKNLHPLSSRVVRTDASDHHPVVAELELQTSAR